MSEHKDTRVRELEAEVERLRAAGTEAVRLGAESRWQVEAENARLREALGFYADIEFHGGDEGQRAREALEAGER